MEKITLETCSEIIKNIDSTFLDNHILFLSEGEDDGQSLYIMEKNGKSFSTLNWYFEGEYSESIIISNLNVKPEMKKQRLGTRLQLLRENLGIQLGAKYSYLWVDKNSWMYDWYIRRGYEYYQEYEHAENNVWMKKFLTKGK